MKKNVQGKTVWNRRMTRRYRKLVTGLAMIGVLMHSINLHAEPVAGQLPESGQVVAGSASISQSGANMTISQTSQRAAVDWKNFSIGSQARVDFAQPGSSSVTLNRVTTAHPSEIYGTINAPGQVFLLNPSGVLFAKGSQVNVGGLVAGTVSMSVDDFMAGKYQFTRNGTSAGVKNEGTIAASDGGLVALFGSSVQNDGVIEARLGTVRPYRRRCRHPQPVRRPLGGTARPCDRRSHD